MVKSKSFTMYDEFELRGYWRIPEEPTKEIAGILTYNLDGINLELFGEFKGEERAQGNELSKYQLVLGRTEDGDDVTLCDGFQTKFKLSGYITTKLTFNKMLIGKSFTSVDSIKFHSLSINYAYLEEWMRHHPFEDQIESNEGVMTKLETTYKFPPVFEAYIHSKETNVKAGYNFNTSGEMYKSKIFQHTGTLEIVPSTLKGLDWYLNFSRELQDLLTFLMNRATFPKKIIAKGGLLYEGEKIREKIYIFTLPEKDFKETRVKHSELFIHYGIIKDSIKDILNNWFENPSYSSRKIYLRNLYNNKVNWETKFLNYAKAIESFHRDTAGEVGQFLKDVDYEVIKATMIEALPADINQDLKNKLSSTLKYAHHHGFERRVRDTFKGMKQEMVNLVFSDNSQLKIFATDIRKTRDYYTHYGDKPDYYFKEWALYFANVRIQIILLYHFCKKLGIDERIVLHCINEDYNLLYRLTSAKKELEH